MPDHRAKTLEAVFSSQQMQHVLYEVARAARVILKVDVSIIFLLSEGDQLKAFAWHGREASESFLSLESVYVKAIWSGRRSINWFRRDRCSDPEVGAILDDLGVVSGLIVPIILNGQYHGIWMVGCSTSRPFTETDETMLMTFSENIALTSDSMVLSAENLRLQREASALYEIGKEISQVMDLNRVLKVIVERTCSLMGAELSYLALADDEKQEVRVVITEGTRAELLGKMVLKYGQGVGGYVATTRKPQLVDKYPTDVRATHPAVDLAASEDIQSIISVPMFTHNGLIGVLFAASRKEAAFDQSQVELLTALGTQAAIAIQNARFYEQEKETADKLSVSLVTNEKLLKLVLRNSGLQAIVDTLSELIGCPVIVEDSIHRIISYTSQWSKPGSKWPFPAAGISSTLIWGDSEMADRLHVVKNNLQSVQLPARPLKKIDYSRIIAPIVAGDSLLGYVQAVEIGTVLNEQQRSAVEQASIVIALEFLKQEAAESVEQRLAGDFLDDLINGRGTNDPTVYQRAARLNVDLNLKHRIMVLDVDRFAFEVARHNWTDIDALDVKRRFYRTVTDVVRKDVPGALIGMQSDSVFLLLPENEHNHLEELTDLGKRIQRSLQSSLPDLSVSIGIGRVADDPSQLPRSFQESQLALRAIAANQLRNGIAPYEELGVLPLLLQSENQAELISFMQRYLNPLLIYDQENGSNLVATLEAYLAASGHMQQAAAACHIHTNSMKYRVQRIEELTGLDLHDGQIRFNLSLAVSIHSALSILELRAK